jgi:hypothetical protein
MQFYDAYDAYDAFCDIRAYARTRMHDVICDLASDPSYASCNATQRGATRLEGRKVNDEALEVSVAAKGLRSTWQAGVLWRQLEPVKP